jgi:S1-C subfamily serine protease
MPKPANAKETTPAGPETDSRNGAKPAAPSPLAASTEGNGRIAVMPAVVADCRNTGGRGSGFYVRHDTLITNVHVVENDGYVTLRRMDGTTVNARVERGAGVRHRDPESGDAVGVAGGDSDGQRALAQPGQEIIVIGSALGTLQNSVSRGIVSGLRTAAARRWCRPTRRPIPATAAARCSIATAR